MGPFEANTVQTKYLNSKTCKDVQYNRNIVTSM